MDAFLFNFIPTTVKRLKLNIHRDRLLLNFLGLLLYFLYQRFLSLLILKGAPIRYALQLRAHQGRSYRLTCSLWDLLLSQNSRGKRPASRPHHPKNDRILLAFRLLRQSRDRFVPCRDRFLRQVARQFAVVGGVGRPLHRLYLYEGLRLEDICLEFGLLRERCFRHLQGVILLQVIFDIDRFVAYRWLEPLYFESLGKGVVQAFVLTNYGEGVAFAPLLWVLKHADRWFVLGFVGGHFGGRDASSQRRQCLAVIFLVEG